MRDYTKKCIKAYFRNNKQLLVQEINRTTNFSTIHRFEDATEAINGLDAMKGFKHIFLDR